MTAVVGDLLEFRESHNYFKLLMNFIFGNCILDIYNVEEDHCFENLLKVQLGLPLDSLFQLNNLGKPFKTEDIEFMPLEDDSRVMGHGIETMDTSIESDLAMLN